MINETIAGEVARVTYESEETSFRVLQVAVEGRGEVTCVGRFQFVGAGTSVRLTGEFTRDQKRGEQFRVHTLVTIEPSTLIGIERYLGSGLIPGVGAALAKRIVAKFGLETLNVLDQAPRRLREVAGVGRQRRIEIERHWREQRSKGSLNLLLATHGISSSLARRIFDQYGDKSAEIVQTSPYRLAMDVQGIGFRTADRIAQSLGIKSDHPERAQAGVLHLLYDISDAGHVFVWREALLQAGVELLAIDVGHVQAAVDALWAKGRVVVEKKLARLDETGTELGTLDDAVFLTLLHHAEVAVAERIFQLAQVPAVSLQGVEEALAAFERHSGVQLAAEQRRAVETAAWSKMVIITGGPGVGKTTIVRAILNVFEQTRLLTVLAAPTGRAAKRLSESTSRPASTLHRLLEFDPKTRRFLRNEENPLEAQAVVVDEASMIDLSLAAALFAALPERARLVIVGDADQLPSVAAGALLRDLIQSGSVPVVALNHVFRQERQSLIVENAHAILQGREPQGAEMATAGADFFVIEREDAERAAATIEELLVRRIPARFGFEPLRDIQVLCPMHRGPCGTTALNQRLQAALNPTGPALNRAGQLYRQGDRVMQLKNDYEKEIWNGDLGRVVRVDTEAEELEVEFEGRVVKFVAAELPNLTLAYATTIHKSQGSEYPVVVLPMLTSHFVMLSRNLLYTAVTRARKLCVLVSHKRALAIALSEVRREQRNTRLAERLRKLCPAVAPLS